MTHTFKPTSPLCPTGPIGLIGPISLLLIFLFAMGFLVQAQVSDNVALVFNPQNPKPGEVVTLKAIATAIDEDKSVFDWYIDNQLIKTGSGKGKTEFSFKLPQKTRTLVDLVITTADGTRLSATRTLTTKRPIIVWWTNTSIPSWYQGRALPAPGSTVTLLAIPGGGFGEKPQNLSYSWSVDVEPQPDVSGLGKNRFDLAIALAEEVTHQISVRISNAEQTLTEDATLLLSAVSPEVLVYNMSATAGAEAGKALSIFEGESGDAHDFIAVPFFFRPEQIKNLKFTWSVNNQTISGKFDKPDVLTLKTNPGEVSRNIVTVNITGVGRNVQTAAATFTANFK